MKLVEFNYFTIVRTDSDVYVTDECLETEDISKADRYFSLELVNCAYNKMPNKEEYKIIPVSMKFYVGE